MSNQLVRNAQSHKALKVRIYPTPQQQEIIEKTFGCTEIHLQQLPSRKIRILYREYPPYQENHNKRTTERNLQDV